MGCAFYAFFIMPSNWELKIVLKKNPTFLPQHDLIFHTLCRGISGGKKTSEEQIVLDFFLASSSVKGETNITIQRESCSKTFAIHYEEAAMK